MIKRIILIFCAAGLSGFSALGDPGEGIHLDNLVIHPFFDASISYDSNGGLLRRTQNEGAVIEEQEGEDEIESDIFTELRLGVNFDYKKEQLLFNGSAWWFDRAYDENVDLDQDGFGETAGLYIGDRERLLFQANQSMEHITDYSRQPALLNMFNAEAQELYLTEDRTDRLERDTFSYGLRLSRDFEDRVEAELGYAVTEVDYDSEEVFDSEDKTLEGQLGFKLTDKSSGFVRGRLGQESNDSFSDDADYQTVHVGIRSRLTEKLNYDLGIGFETYEVPSEDGIEEKTDEDLLSFDVVLNWKYSYKTTIQLNGRNYIQSSSFSAGNTRETTIGQLSILRRLTEDLTLGLSGSLRSDDYHKPIVLGDLVVDEKRESVAGNVTLNFAPPGKWYRLYAQVSYEDSSSQIEGENYEQLRASGGLSLYY